MSNKTAFSQGCGAQARFAVTEYANVVSTFKKVTKEQL